MTANRALSRVQSRLSELYDVRLDADVADFVFDAETAEAVGGPSALIRGEVLFVLDAPEGPEVGLYVDPRALEAVAAGNAWTQDFASMCLAAEGVSHFVYVQFRADHADSVQELELELQAEVDKYALGLLDTHTPRALEGNGVGLIRERSRALRHQLYAEVAYLDEASTERGTRYRDATRFAQRYTAHLERAWIERGELSGLVAELRRFYRMGLREKVERCER